MGLFVAIGAIAVNLRAGPNLILPYEGKPGCLDALRAKLAALTGCLGAWIVRGLWVAVGVVIGAVLGRGCE